MKKLCMATMVALHQWCHRTQDRARRCVGPVPEQLPAQREQTSAVVHHLINQEVPRLQQRAEEGSRPQHAAQDAAHDEPEPPKVVVFTIGVHVAEVVLDTSGRDGSRTERCIAAAEAGAVHEFPDDHTKALPSHCVLVPLPHGAFPMRCMRAGNVKGLLRTCRTLLAQIKVAAAGLGMELDADDLVLMGQHLSLLRIDTIEKTEQVIGSSRVEFRRAVDLAVSAHHEHTGAASVDILPPRFAARMRALGFETLQEVVDWLAKLGGDALVKKHVAAVCAIIGPEVAATKSPGYLHLLAFGYQHTPRAQRAALTLQKLEKAAAEFQRAAGEGALKAMQRLVEQYLPWTEPKLRGTVGMGLQCLVSEGQLAPFTVELAQLKARENFILKGPLASAAALAAKRALFDPAIVTQLAERLLERHEVQPLLNAGVTDKGVRRARKLARQDLVKAQPDQRGQWLYEVALKDAASQFGGYSKQRGLKDGQGFVFPAFTHWKARLYFWGGDVSMPPVASRADALHDADVLMILRDGVPTPKHKGADYPPLHLLPKLPRTLLKVHDALFGDRCSAARAVVETVRAWRRAGQQDGPQARQAHEPALCAAVRALFKLCDREDQLPANYPAPL